jgi:hypothetical protein
MDRSDIHQAAVETLAAVVAHCKLHCHSGVSLGYHQCCFDVLLIADPNGSQADARARAKEVATAAAGEPGPSAERSDARADSPDGGEVQAEAPG